MSVRDFRACLLAIGKDEWSYYSKTDDTLIESISDADYTTAKAAYDALEYSRLRKAKYDLLNQFEMRFDDQVNSTTTWVDAINAIKTAHPKT